MKRDVKFYTLYNANDEVLGDFNSFNDCLFYLNELKIGEYKEVCIIGGDTRKRIITRHVYVIFSKWEYVSERHWVDLAILPNNSDYKGNEE